MNPTSTRICHYIFQIFTKSCFYDHHNLNKHCSIEINSKLNIGQSSQSCGYDTFWYYYTLNTLTGIDYNFSISPFTNKHLQV